MRNPSFTIDTPPAAHEVDQSAFACDVLAALARRPRSIPPKYFYDAQGSALFDRICELPEYYPTRTELRILTERAAALSRCSPEMSIGR